VINIVHKRREKEKKKSRGVGSGSGNTIKGEGRTEHCLLDLLVKVSRREGKTLRSE
jgi:hypothetical protein